MSCTEKLQQVMLLAAPAQILDGLAYVLMLELRVFENIWIATGCRALAILFGGLVSTALIFTSKKLTVLQLILGYLIAEILSVLGVGIALMQGIKRYREEYNVLPVRTSCVEVNASVLVQQGWFSRRLLRVVPSRVNQDELDNDIEMAVRGHGVGNSA